MLVSVRNATEAHAAVAGGCDLLDIKDPARGPLGMADAGVMAEMARFASECRGDDGPLPCSAALGELAEWESPNADESLPRGISFVKFGSAGIETPEKWIEIWHRVQSGLVSTHPEALHWVAVAYADWQAAQSLEPWRLLDGACSVASDAVLIDTFDKSSGNLLQLMKPAELEKFADVCHRAGLHLALAGGLRGSQFAELVNIRPDIIGVRGAACTGGCRTAAVSADAVRALKRDLRASFAPEHEAVARA